MRTLRAHVLIIGSGAAGGVLAATLAELLPGRRIIVAEKGAYYGAEFFNQREWDMRVLYADGGRRSTYDGAIPVRGGECVGGGTTINAALCFDPLPEVWRSWNLEEFSFDPAANDYGVPRLNMQAVTADVRERINVHAASDEDLNDNNRVFEAGCRRLGIASRRFGLNLRGCTRCGFITEGCAYDAKQGTMITYLADALKSGVQLIHHFDVDTIAMRNGVATGATGRVRPTASGSRPNSLPAGPLQIDARLVIVAAGAIASPLLLMRSGHPDPHRLIGRGLVLHPSLPVIGVMPDPITNHRGIPGTVYSDEYRASHGLYLECLFGHPVYGSTVMPSFGREHFERMKKLSRIAGFGVMLVDSADAHNRVELTPTGSRIRYQLTSSDRERFRFGAERAVELMFACGAEEVLLASDESLGDLPAPHFRHVREAPHARKLAFLPHRTVVTSAHCQATVKMSSSPEAGSINARCESHQVRNLIVCDSSSFPTSCGANPMIAIMALARYQGRRIAAEWSRYDS